MIRARTWGTRPDVNVGEMECPAELAFGSGTHVLPAGDPC